MAEVRLSFSTVAPMARSILNSSSVSWMSGTFSSTQRPQALGPAAQTRDLMGEIVPVERLALERKAAVELLRAVYNEFLHWAILVIFYIFDIMHSMKMTAY